MSGFDLAKLDPVSKWAAGGFVLLTSLLTFFGIKDGYLDRILAEDGQVAVAVFVLIGGGVVLSLIGGAASGMVRVNTGFTWIGLAVPVAYAAHALSTTDAGPQQRTVILAVVVLALLVAVSWARDWQLALPVSVLAIAVAATSAGLYTAVRLSVESKATGEALQLTASVKAGSSDVTVTVKGERQPREVKRLVVIGIRSGPDGNVARAIGHMDFQADQVNEIDQTYSFPVSVLKWDRIIVTIRCGKGFEEPCKDAPRQMIWRGSSTAGGRIGGSLTLASATSLQAKVEAHGLRPGRRVTVRLIRVRPSRAVTSVSTLIGDGDSDATYSTQAAVEVGQVWQLQARRCDHGCAGWRRVSSYVVD